MTIALERHPFVAGVDQRALSANVKHSRRCIADAPGVSGLVGEFGQHRFVRASARTFDTAPDATTRIVALHCGDHALERDALVPEIEHTHVGILAHMALIALRHQEGKLVGGEIAVAKLPTRNGETRDEPLDVPFPRPGRGFIEIVQVENERAPAWRSRRS